MTFPRFPVSFDDGHVALGVRADAGTDLGRALRAMGLTTGVPTIVAVGAGSRPAQLSRLGPLLEKVVVAVAEAVDATVVDEGDAGGLAEALGRARRHKKAGFPFVGVASHGARPGDIDPDALDSAHTHLVFVPSGPGAGLAGWIASVATAVAGGNRSVALAVAGRDPAWDSVAAQVRAGRLVMAVARSGGVADHLAAAVAGRPADRRAQALVASGQIFAVDPSRGAAYVADTLRSALSRPDALGPAREAGRDGRPAREAEGPPRR
ncbi:MAG: hypothetical protein ACR2KK_01260 [Acidimicrobiales bacterium]